MRTHSLIVATWLFGSVVAASIPPPTAADDSAAAVPDVLHYDIVAVVHETGISEVVTLSAAVTRNPGRWTLALAPEMKLVGAESGGKAVPFTVGDRTVDLDVAGIHVEAGKPLSLTLRVEGSPLEVNKGMGFVRSQVRPDILYVRSQYPWYPRAPGDPATSRVLVEVPRSWRVRTAGTAKAPEMKGDRAVWTFERLEAGRDLGLIAGPYRRLESPLTGALALDALALAGHEKATEGLLSIATRALRQYAAQFGTLRETRYSLVEVPKEFGAGSGYGEDGYLLLGAGAFEPQAGSWAAELVAHEAAHAWWGNAVPFSDFASEALANWSMLAFLAKEQGEEAARAVRRRAVGRLEKVVAAGKDVALSEVRGFGAGMDPEVYQAMAYEKGMMLLVMVEQALGEARWRDLMRRFLESSRGKTVGWAALCDAVCGAAPEARVILEEWAGTGLPLLRTDVKAVKESGKWAVAGILAQEGTDKPRPMRVRVVATCGGKEFSSTVDLRTSRASLRFATPKEPETLVIDPDFLVLARRDAPGIADPRQAFEDAFAVVSNPKDADPQRCAKALAALRGLVASGKAENEGECRVGIGRLLFRTAKLADAKTELETALRIGVGPFHRSWASLRLGCIEDLAKRRDAAVAHYEAVVGMKGASATVVQMAKRFLEAPYRGYDRDG